MSTTPPSGPPVVEPKPSGDNAPSLTLRALQQRIRQQEILSELGVTALQGARLEQLLNETARLVAEGLRADFSKVLEFDAAKNQFLVRAGVGWGPGVVGVATVGSDLASPAGFALRTGKPVISNHLEAEERFRTPDILQQHGVRRAMNVILQGDGRPFGVLEVDSKSDDDFEAHDLAFLQGAANILGMAIERERHERRLKAALDRHQVLLREMNHRVKNSLALVSSMLSLQARDVGDPEVTAHLKEASYRVSAIARAHDQLSLGANVEYMDIGRYIEAICRDLDASVAHCQVETEAEIGIEVETDRAISLALVVNELITNAAKYAYRDRAGGRIWIKVRRSGPDRFSVSVRDAGEGLPADFDIATARSLGMRIVSLFARQLEAQLEVRDCAPGTEFILLVSNRRA